MEEPNTSSMSLSRTPKEIKAIFVPKVREPLLKRPLDVAFSSLMLILSAPISLLIALAIKLEDGGPIFYRQERWGRGGACLRLRQGHFLVLPRHPTLIFCFLFILTSDALHIIINTS